MGRQSHRTQAKQKNVAKARFECENRHEKVKRELREHLAEKCATLELFRNENEKIKTAGEQQKIEIFQIKEKIRERVAQVEQLNGVVSSTQKKLIDSLKASDFVRNQIAVLRRANIQLQDENEHIKEELRSARREHSESIRSAVEAGNRAFGMIHQKKMDDMERKISELTASSPTGGSCLKSYKKGNRRDTTNARCKKALESLKKTVALDDFDDFLTDLCHFIAKEPSYSFKLTLSDIDCFYATVKWKWSDGFLKEFKSFLSNRLGFDMLCSRQKIASLRKIHSNSDNYKITVSPIMRKVGGGEVQTESAIIEATDISRLLSRRLEHLFRSGLLKVDGPDCPIVIGVGGDKGGDHTKVVVVLGNVENPNNPHGILLIGMYEGSDDYSTLKVKLENVFEMINNLKTIEYLENDQIVKRVVQKLPIGDCKFLSAVLGHPGQSSSRPCFMCTLPWSYKGQNAATVGTFDLSKCGAPYNLADLKEPLLRAETSAIAPPELHTFLGIVQTYVLDWLFALCNTIDFGEYLPDNLKLQRKTLRNLLQQEDFYGTRYCSTKTTSELIEKMLLILDKAEKSSRHHNPKFSACDAAFCFHHLALSKDSMPKCDTFRCDGCDGYLHEHCALIVTPDDREKNRLHAQKCFDCRKKGTVTLDARKQELLKIKKIQDKQLENDEDILDDVICEKEKLENMLTKSSGPTRKQLESVLRLIGCDFRAFYQQLTGNQARKMLRPENVEKIIGVFPTDQDDKLIPMKRAMMVLGEIMSSANNEEKSDEDIDKIRELLSKFELSLKEAQPFATISPKLHLLCAHLVPYLELHRSWGHVTEQGVESFHPLINSLNIRFSSVFNVSQRAELIVKHLSNYNFLYDCGDSWFKPQ